MRSAHVLPCVTLHPKIQETSIVFTWHGLSRSGGESLPPMILRVATSISQTSVVSIRPDHKLEINTASHNCY